MLCAGAPVQAALPLAANAVESSQVYGLILKCTLGLSRNDCGEIVVTAKTQATGLMSEVGFSDIILQRSADGTNWEDVQNLGSRFGRNVRYFIVDDLVAPAEEGYYYRAVCTHYVTSTVTGTKTQTAENSSRALWISESSVPSDSTHTLPADEPKTADETVTTAAPQVTTAPSTAAATSSVKQQTTAKPTTTAAAKKSGQTDSPATGGDLPTGTAILLAAAAATAFTVRKRKDD